MPEILAPAIECPGTGTITTSVALVCLAGIVRRVDHVGIEALYVRGGAVHIVAAVPQAQQVRVRDEARCEGDDVLQLESDGIVESAKRDLCGLFVDGQIDHAFATAVAAVGIIQRGGGIQGGEELGTDCLVDVVPLEEGRHGIPCILIVGIVQEDGKDIF
jgi:hypothetical protein